MVSELGMLALNTHPPFHACSGSCWQASPTPAPCSSMEVAGRLCRGCTSPRRGGRSGWVAPGPLTARGMWLGVKHPKLSSTPQPPWAPTLLKKSLLGKLCVKFMDVFSSRKCWDDGLMLLTCGCQDKETLPTQASWPPSRGPLTLVSGN